MRTSLLGCLTALFMITGQALAQDPMADTGEGPSRVFGAKGQMALSSDVALLIQRSSQDTTTIQFAPAADYFVANNFSLGGTILLDYTQTNDSDSTRFGIGPRLGYNLTFSDMLSIWPKIGFSYSHTSASTDVAAGDDAVLTRNKSGDHFTLNMFAPIMFHPVSHFFVGFGPFLDTDLSGSNKTTTFGGRLALGGWFEI